MKNSSLLKTKYDQKKIFCIVLSYNSIHNTINCIQSLQKSEYSNLEIIVVDNASEDNSAKIIKNTYPSLVVIENEKNLGFAGGNNIGIKFALSQKADYILLSNNDVFVYPDTISRLLKTAEINSTIGAVAPKILEYENPKIISFAGGKIINWKARTVHVGQGEEDNDKYNIPKDCDYLTGAFLLVKRKVIEKIGLMPEIYFMYWEDADWCLNMRNSGFRLIYCPEAVIKHKVSASTNGVPLSLIITEYIGAKYFIKRWVKKKYKVSAHIYHVFYFLRRILCSIKLKAIKINEAFF